MRPSFTLLFIVIFMLFICHSLWNLIDIFRAPPCNKGDTCFASYLNSEPPLELLIYTSETVTPSNAILIYNSYNFDYFKQLDEELSIDIPPKTRNNGSLYIHVIIMPRRKVDKALRLQEAAHARDAIYLKKKLTHYAVPKSSTFNLLKDEEKQQTIKPVAHLKGRFAITMCVDQLNMGSLNVPVELLRHIQINSDKQFLPIVQQDFMQTRLKDLIEITGDSREMAFTFTYAPSSIGKIRFLLQIEATLTQFLSLGFTEKDLDEIKGVFADTNLYLLCATFFIGSVHLLFDFLSFKNDVSFWKSNSSMAGLSTRTVLWRAFSQTVVFLFLLDEGTSLLVLIPCGVATVIEFWKIKKVLKARIEWENRLPRIRFDQIKYETHAEAKTREYDEECMRYLSFVLYPLCIGAAIYSLVYQSHKSWYSWTINSLVNGVYAFGFLFMLPQLFVNYRLKSVAALPWRAFMYRAFNTFIDDIFAFIITMPTAHRVACFRDDIVFVIYLYQRWLYPVDETRRDDGVTTGELEEKKEK
ncbi:hypothetical protein PPYR_14066 [Photinus pyralis]|uniref:Lipid scramblase CLPTM1L n=1 Tax=Photinus pyralis TaxID=7054 RepID=A0A5N4A450_PHOPY|nr:cleft lip and palate transmembrane protein 1-like protein [Photinus pyralis]KAB0792105.1 hypothetical protein PPYR_14066 [Photinus pyralis]